MQILLQVLFWLVVAVILITAFTSAAWFPLFLAKLGDIDEGWNPVRRLPPEGEMFALASGSPKGPFVGLLESVSSHIYDKSTKEMRPPNPGEDKPDNYLRRNGVTLVRFNRYVIQRAVHYNKWEMLPGGEWGLVRKDREGPSIFFQYNMATEITQAETSDNFPVSAIVNLTVQIFCPEKALFFSGGWEVQVNAGVQGVLRQHISTRDINQLRLEEADDEEDDIVKLLSHEDSDLNNHLNQFGVRIVAATFVDFDLVEGDPDVAKATKAAGIAKLQKEAAGDKAAAITIEYEARLKSAGKHAGTFRMAEAIEVAKPRAIGGSFVANVDD